MKSTLSALLVAAASVAAVPAFAGSPAADHQARLLGLPTDTYSMAQMVQLTQALQEDDTTTVNYILSRPALAPVTQNNSAYNANTVDLTN